MQKVNLKHILNHNHSPNPVVLNLFYPMHSFNLLEILFVKNTYISTLWRETKLFTIAKLNYSTL